MLDLSPATKTLATLVDGVRDDQLTARTPCEAITLGQLLDHVDSLSTAFTGAATKTPGPGGPPPKPDAARLGADFRERIAGQLDALAAAWSDPAAWQGMTQAGGLDLPGELAGVIALNEVLVHGWDVAVASGQPFTADPDHVAAAYDFVGRAAKQNPEGTPGLFGPPVRVSGDAPLLDRLLGCAGRDPSWTPSG